GDRDEHRRARRQPGNRQSRRQRCGRARRTASRDRFGRGLRPGGANRPLRIVARQAGGAEPGSNPAIQRRGRPVCRRLAAIGGNRPGRGWRRGDAEGGRMMLAVRTPLRVSLFGGGTDYPAYFRREPGAVLGFTIDKYIYLSALRLSAS